MKPSSLPAASQVQLLLELCREIESVWSNPSERGKRLKELGKKIEELGLDVPDRVHLQKLLPLTGKEPNDPKILQTIIAPIQRTFERTDAPIFVEEGDRDAAPSAPPMDVDLILENIRSAHNVGSIFRTADALGCRHIHLVGYTPDAKHPRVSTASMGATETVNSSWSNSVEDLADRLRAEGRMIYGLETATQSENIFETQLQFPCAILVGNERFGLSQAALAKCDQVLRLPMFGIKNSLNVANCIAVAGYRFRNQWDVGSSSKCLN